MKELLCFLAGYIISGAVSVILMCLMQINRLRDYDEMLKSALLSGRKNNDSDDIHGNGDNR